MTRSPLVAIVACALCLPRLAAAQGTASGSVTIDGTPTRLTHAVRTTRPNVFDGETPDPVIVLSNQPLTTAEASDDALLLSRAQSAGLVTLAVRYDGRKGREKLFNVAIRYKGANDAVLLPDVWFKDSLKAGAGMIALAKQDFSGHTYEANVEYSVPVPKETTEVAAAKTPAGGPKLPPPSKTDADRKAAAALLIETLKEGDETKALEVVRLGIDPNVRDEKMNIPLINWAVLMCQPLVVKELVALKADLTPERLPGMTLLSEATAACPEAVPFLKAGGAK